MQEAAAAAGAATACSSHVPPIKAKVNMQNAVGVTADVTISCTSAALHWSATFWPTGVFSPSFIKKEKKTKSAVLTSRSQKWPSRCAISGVISGSGAAIERPTQRTHKRGRWSLRPRTAIHPGPASSPSAPSEEADE